MGFMKKIIFAFLCFSISRAFSYDAIVIVLEAPLLKEPKLNSTVYQVLRKGNHLFVPNELADLDALPEFIQTYDRVGNIAYIPTKYIKIITNNLDEEKMPITYKKNDPTDYRIEEEIPNTYPFDNTSYLRANLAFTSGNNMQNPYGYNSSFSKQIYSSTTGARLTVTRKIVFDKYDRYYFGLYGTVMSANNKIQFKNSNEAVENRSILRLGPVITFDAFKTSQLRFTVGTGFTYNLHKSSIRMASNEESEERLFSGYSLSPIANSYLQIVDVLPNTDLITGLDLAFFLPHTQTTADEVTIPELWGTETPNQIIAGFKPQLSLFLGIQVKY